MKLSIFVLGLLIFLSQAIRVEKYERVQKLKTLNRRTHRLRRHRMMDKYPLTGMITKELGDTILANFLGGTTSGFFGIKGKLIGLALDHLDKTNQNCEFKKEQFKVEDFPDELVELGNSEKSMEELYELKEKICKEKDKEYLLQEKVYERFLNDQFTSIQQNLDFWDPVDWANQEKDKDVLKKIAKEALEQREKKIDLNKYTDNSFLGLAGIISWFVGDKEIYPIDGEEFSKRELYFATDQGKRAIENFNEIEKEKETYHTMRKNIEECPSLTDKIQYNKNKVISAIYSGYDNIVNQVKSMFESLTTFFLCAFNSKAAKQIFGNILNSITTAFNDGSIIKTIGLTLVKIFKKAIGLFIAVVMALSKIVKGIKNDDMKEVAENIGFILGVILKILIPV